MKVSEIVNLLISRCKYYSRDGMLIFDDLTGWPQEPCNKDALNMLANSDIFGVAAYEGIFIIKLDILYKEIIKEKPVE